MKYAEVTQEMINGWVDKYLSNRGFDLSKEIQCHAKWENEGRALTSCYSQDENAEYTEEAKRDAARQSETVRIQTERPAYLKDLGATP
jgi:hypothetical protein